MLCEKVKTITLLTNTHSYKFIPEHVKLAHPLAPGHSKIVVLFEFLLEPLFEPV